MDILDDMGVSKLSAKVFFKVNYSFNSSVFIIFHQNNFPSLLQHLFFDDVFTGAIVGQPVTHMRSTNRNPQPSNQFPIDKIKSRPTFFLHLDHNGEEKTNAFSISHHF